MGNVKDYRDGFNEWLNRPKVDEIPKIDLAWEVVNCLGGQSVQNNSYDQGFVDAIGKALEEIEKLGGKDPSYQRADQRLSGS